MIEEKDSQAVEKWSAQTIFQRLAAVRDWQYIIEEYGNVNGREELIKEARETLKDLQTQLKTQIGVWGGVEAIDGWLKENDPGHNVPSEIEEMDWSWLEQAPEELSSS